MKSIRLLDRRAGYSLSAIGLLLGMVAPVALPAFASADVLSSRSIILSSSAADASNVTYDINFTGAVGNDIDGTASTEGGVVIYFCSNSPLLEAACTAPGGLSTASVSVNATEYDGSPVADGTVAHPAANSVVWTAGADYTGGDSFRLVLDGIHNPTATGTFYARITTYANNTTLATSDGTDATAEGTYMDNGSVALSATSELGVTAYVLESMTFCVSKGDMGDSGNASAVSTQAAPSINCGSNEASCPTDPGCVVAPSMTIGQQNGTVNALDATHLSTGQVYAQLSTNAASGAIVNLKSDATSCGGLYRNGNTANCNIAPKAAAGSFTAGQAFFGLTVGTAAAAPLVNGGAGSGTGTITPGTGYGATDYFIDYDTDNDNSQGITSTYGSELFHSTAPVDNMNVPISFGASVSSTTPAGSYGATLNMIATGTY